MAKGNFNTKHREYLRQKMIIRNKQNIGKTFEEIYGDEKAKKLKDKISVNLTGRKMSEKNKKILFDISKNRIVLQETRDKLSKTRKELGLAKGQKNPNWNGGLSFLPYSEDFNKSLKNEIRKRDDYTCQICLIKDVFSNFPIHHIDYNKMNNSKDNLITICNYCHGKTNKSRNVWKAWFSNIMKIKNLQLMN
jgi:hypothetical protein